MGNERYQSGQALLLVLLAMAVLATMVLSVVSRSVTDVGVTTVEEESLRAFSAAEAGVEEALVSGNIDEPPIENEFTVPAQTGPDAEVSKYTASVTSYPEDPSNFNYPFGLLSGDGATVLFREDITSSCPGANCFTGNSVTLCWAKSPGTGSEVPAVFVNVIYETSGGEYAISPVGFDPNDSRREGSMPNGFADELGSCTASFSIDGQNYLHRATVDLSGIIAAGGDPVLMRVTMLYNDVAQTFGVKTSQPLPPQGKMVSSEGSAGDVKRRVNAFLLNPEIPFVFDAALYSDASIVK